MRPVRGKEISITLLFLCIAFSELRAQSKNLQFFEYKRRFHFGFTIGTNVSSLKRSYSEAWYQQDSVKSVEQQKFPGINIGVVTNLHLGEHFDLRMVLPTFVLAQRNLFYYNNLGHKSQKQIESALLEAPLLLKFKSVRHTNLRYYVIGGVKYAYDLSSDEGAVEDPTNPKVILKPHNFSYEYGTGLDFYMKYFKFSPELKFTRGLNNVLVPGQKVYSKVFSEFKSNYIFVSFYFEG